MTVFHYTEVSGVKSSAIDTVAFNDKTGEMAIKFVAGNWHHYTDVPKPVFNEFAGAASVGRYYNSYIFGEYDGQGLGYDVELAPEVPEPVASGIQDFTGMYPHEWWNPLIPVSPPVYPNTTTTTFTIDNRKYTVVALVEDKEIAVDINAISDDAALAQFNARFEGIDLNIKVKAVVRHFE